MAAPLTLACVMSWEAKIEEMFTMAALLQLMGEEGVWVEEAFSSKGRNFCATITGAVRGLIG